MIVLTLSKCPQGLKGDVTKWLMEVNTGVYVGKLSARVRDLLWKRVCEHCGAGKATMVFTARNEQGFSFYVHNTDWKPIDFDGLLLLKKPYKNEEEKLRQQTLKNGGDGRNIKSKQLETKRSAMQEKPVDISASMMNENSMFTKDFVAIDLETTGLKSDLDRIIELGAVRYRHGQIESKYQALVKSEKPIPSDIIKLTGINNEMLDKDGELSRDAVEALLEFIGKDIIVGHYISFDMLFLRKTCKRLNLDFQQFQIVDTVALAKTLCTIPVDNYRLETLVKALGIAEYQSHRALPDAVLAAKLYLKLNEKG